ncbi:hypothetical protein A6B39_02250 [Mannheimia granulomatis]|uniref:restriction endonuclease subunit S n=1 Tax=Mannheimia granulomatis TaxID=85402 RepID=UPI00159D09B0|nr:restriction endonuclease subunit S [Mannheimia granulomatis]QLB14350.1 hypothetical protein A6B39_02250 [Mannheimia granulomatis]
MKKIKLSSIFDIARGGSPRPIQDYLTDDKNGINWIMIGDTIEGNKYIEKTAKKIKPSGIKKSRKVYVGDFLLTNSMSFGRPYILKIDGCIHDGWLVLSPRSPNISTDYFYYLLSSRELKSEMGKQAAGAVVKNLNSDIVRNIEVKYPDLPTQTRIAQILDKADQIRQKRKKAIELADEFLRSLFLEMFGDPVVNPKGWETEELKNFTEFENGDRSSNYPSGKDLLPRGIPFLSTKNINSDTYSEIALNYISEDKFNSLSRGKVNNGDILITLRGTLASCCIFNSKYERAFINAQMMIIRTNKTKISNDFLHSLLTFSTVNYKLKNLGQGAAVPQLTAKQLQEFKVIIPPLEKQNIFLNIKRKISDLKHKIEMSKTDELFNSLSQQYFAKVE